MGSKSKQRAARLGDIDTGHPPSPPTPIITGSTNVLTNGRPAARKGDKLVPHHPGIRTITEGSATVLINGKPAARVMDGINCGGKIIIGSGNVYIGDKPEAPRNVKSEMEFDAIMDAAFEPENRNLTPFQQAEMEAAIAVKYNPKKGAAPVWHEYFMSYEPEPGNHLSDVQKTGYQKARIEKAKLAAEELADAKDIANANSPDQLALDALTDTLIAVATALGKDDYANQEMKSIAADMLDAAGFDNSKQNNNSQKTEQEKQKLDQSIKQKQIDPHNFDDARAILKNSRKNIAKNGAPDDKYTQEELLHLAEQGEVPDKYIVRIIKSKYLGENRDGLIGTKGDHGEIKYWSTTLDQIEQWDTDPRLLVPGVGLDYDPDAHYTMVIIDKEQAQQGQGSYAMLPNYVNMNNFTKAELANELPHADLIDETLTEETSAMYLEAYQAMEGIEKDGAWKEKNQQAYFKTAGFNESDKKVFYNRLALHKMAGANEHFLGNGLTKNLNDKDGSKPFATVETYAYDKNPETFKAMLSKDNPMVAIVHLREIPGVTL